MFVNGHKKKYGVNMRKISIDSHEQSYELFRFDVPAIEFEDGTAL